MSEVDRNYGIPERRRNVPSACVAGYFGVIVT
jgi:hypothetical protein